MRRKAPLHLFFHIVLPPFYDTLITLLSFPACLPKGQKVDIEDEVGGAIGIKPEADRLLGILNPHRAVHDPPTARQTPLF